MSAIISDTINENFPIAGVDNDSQGFRTNFNVIKTALSVANSEITDLQNNVVRNDQDNDLSNIYLENFTVRNMQEAVITGPTNLSTNFWDVSGENSGSYWTAQSNGNENIVLRSWPVSGSNVKMYKIRIALRSSGAADVITFSASGGTVWRDDSTKFTAGSSNGTQRITLNASQNIHTVIDAWTIDGGTNVYLNYIGQFQV